MTIPGNASSVSVSLIQVLKNYAAGMGIDFDAIAHGAGVDLAIPGDVNARVPGHLFESMWRQVAASGKDPHPGLNFGREMGRHYPGGSILFTLMMNCATIDKALDAFVRYHRIMADAIQPQLSRRGEFVHLSWTVLHPEGAPLPHLSEALLCIFQSILERLSQGRLAPSAVYFTHPGPDDRNAYEDIFKSPVNFEAQHDELVIAADALAMEIQFANHELFKVIESHAVRTADALDKQDQWSRRVMHLICDMLAKGTPPDIDEVSKTLAMSRRSLQQKLKDEGTGFRDCLAKVRKHTALDLLGQPSVTICDVAFLLGYSEQSAFNHAFRRWTSMTPKDYCRR